MCTQVTLHQIPKSCNLRDTVNGFRDRLDFPLCAGDGTHVPIIGPLVNKVDYYNRKVHYSVKLLAVADHNLQFWSIIVGWSGKIHDERMFANYIFPERPVQNSRGLVCPFQ